MIITGFETAQNGQRKRVSAQIAWEDCARDDLCIWFEVDEAFAPDLECNPGAFLTAAVMPAMHYGEKRVRVAAGVRPEVRLGLETVLRWMRKWYYPADHVHLKIEADDHPAWDSKRPPERAGFFLSGGIDSLGILLENRQRFPSTHPRFFRDGLLLFGLEVSDPLSFEFALRRILVIAQEAGLVLLPVYTNVRELDDDWYFWEYQWEGSVFSAAARMLSRRLTHVSIASTYSIESMHALGSHPLIDPLYSDLHLQVHHDGTLMTRLEKTLLVASWAPALHNLRVCNQSQLYQDGRVNCGQCEKCIRTMLGLIVAGALQTSAAFSRNDLAARGLFDGFNIYPSSYQFYREMVAPLERVGRGDLAKAVEEMLAARSVKASANQPLARKIRAGIKELDRKFLNGFIRNIARQLKGATINSEVLDAYKKLL
jgi:hypothetical protein